MFIPYVYINTRDPNALVVLADTFEHRHKNRDFSANVEYCGKTWEKTCNVSKEEAASLNQAVYEIVAQYHRSSSDYKDYLVQTKQIRNKNFYFLVVPTRYCNALHKVVKMFLDPNNPGVANVQDIFTLSPNADRFERGRDKCCFYNRPQDLERYFQSSETLLARGQGRRGLQPVNRPGAQGGACGGY